MTDEPNSIPPEALRQLLDSPVFREASDRFFQDVRSSLSLPDLTFNPFQHVVTVSRAIRGRRTKLHDFAALKPKPPASWVCLPASSMKQRQQWAQRTSGEEVDWEDLPPPRRKMPVRSDTNRGFTPVIGIVSLAIDFQPPAHVFLPILDALFYGGCNEVDIDDLKNVVRELGRELDRVGRGWGHAESLYPKILERCSTIC